MSGTTTDISSMLPSIKELDSIIISDTSGWEKIAKEYKVSGKVKITILGTDIEISPIYILKYLRSMSQIIIHSSLELYKKRKGLRSNDLLAQAFGSDNPTSDYDVSFVGKGSTELLKMIYENFKKSFPMTNLPLSYDTNGYLGPEFIVYGGSDTPLHSLIGSDNIFSIETLPSVSGVSGERGNQRCIALPITPVAIRAEAVSVLSKFNKSKSHGSGEPTKTTEELVKEYDARYGAMFEIGKRIESYLYGDDASRSSSGISDELSYWTTIHSLLQNSIEAYHTISTIIAVVIFLQQKNDSVITKLTKDNWLIAALENIADLIEHGGIISTPSSTTYTPTTDQTHRIHTSKYVLRVIKCLEHTDKLDKEEANAMIQKVNKIVSLRGQAMISGVVDRAMAAARGVTDPVSEYDSEVTKLINLIPEIVDHITKLSSTGAPIAATSRKLIRRNTLKITQQSQREKSRRARNR